MPEQNGERREPRGDLSAAREKDTGNMLWGITVLAVAALGAVIAYGYQYSFRGALLAFLCAVLGYAIGGVVGFLFGFPRYSDAAAVQTVEDLKAALASSSSADKAESGRGHSPIRHSTNLERITDWLMTMIIGATVINLKNLAEWLSERFKSLGDSIISTGVASGHGSSADSIAAGALLVLPFMVAGFLCMYLWARRYLPRAWREADDDLYRSLAKKTEKLDKVAEHIRAVQEEQTRQIDELKYAVNPSVLKRFQETMTRFGADSTAVEDVMGRYRKASSWADEPLKGLGPAISNGFHLSATVSRETDGVNPFRVDIRISRVDNIEFSAAIAMLYHNSYDNPIEITVYQGPAFLDSTWIEDAYTIGAMVVTEKGGTTLLSLDLEALPNLPEGFVYRPERK